MAEFKIPVEKTALALDANRCSVNLTMPWFAEKAKYPPRAGNVVLPLINGQMAFKTVHDAIAGARKSVDIISWGFDPSMRLIRPRGLRLGELLRAKAEAKPGVEVRVLIWKSTLASFFVHNIIGDGAGGSGGGSAGLGSGVGSTAAGNGKTTSEGGFAEYGPGSGPRSASVGQYDPEAKEFNRNWFKSKTDKLSFRTRDFSVADSQAIAEYHRNKHGMANTKMRLAMMHGASHHQKTILVDYELPEHAVGFVMGHNLLTEYWDTDKHDYYSDLRIGFKPWQDLSLRVYGPVLYDLNENFCAAWTKAQPWWGKDQPISAARKALKPAVFETPAANRGQPDVAQICRTQPQYTDRSILDSYKLALGNARNYVYFENQYFRSMELAKLIRTNRRELKACGWKRDFYIFAVTNKPAEAEGVINTYEMLAALGKATAMPNIDKLRTGGKPENADSKALRSKDLEGVNIHVCTLLSCGTEITEPEPYQNGWLMDGIPNMVLPEPRSRTVYKDIYVHSKLLLVDDVFFTVGSANINIRSMEVDSELNIAMPSPRVTQQWRRHLWGLHTGRSPSDDPKDEFRKWKDIMSENGRAREAGRKLSSSLIEFYDDCKTGSQVD